MADQWTEYLENAHRPSPEAEAIARDIVDASFVVHRDLGPGFVESTYENALALELELRGLPFTRQLVIPVHYRGSLVGEYRPDFVVGELVVVELKAIRSEPAELHVAQVLSYLRATNLGLGFVVNFGLKTFKAGVRRVVLEPRSVASNP